MALTVFVCSTLKDLDAYREAARNAISRLRQHADDTFYWSAEPEGPLTASLAHVRLADVMILLVAHRYGTVFPGERASVSELEFDTAVANKIPVFAFIVDDAHPWPPAFIDVDPVHRQKLQEFRDKVRRYCTSRPFSTVDSLEAAVSQAIAGFDAVLRKEALPQETRLRRRLKPRDILTFTPDGLVQVGFAPDGAPLLIDVHRGKDLAKPLKALASEVHREITHEPFPAFQRQLEEEGRRCWSQQGVHRISLPDSEAETFYVASTTLVKFFPDTLLGSLIQSPLSQSDVEERTTRDATLTRLTAIDQLNDSTRALQSLGGENRFLAISLDSDKVITAGVEKTDAGETIWRWWRPFHEESLQALKNSSFEITALLDSSPIRVWQGPIREYLSALGELAHYTEYGSRYVTIRFFVPRTSLLEILGELAAKIASVHREGRVHGDLKPSNVLLTSSGVVVIDSLDLATGNLPPALSPGWAAPEQLLLQPVTPATDVYALGIMLMKALNGVLTGPVSLFMLPDGSIVRTIADPLVYFDPSGIHGSALHRTAWQALIQDCIERDATKRPPTAEDFRRRLQHTLQEWPVTGELSMPHPLSPWSKRQFDMASISAPAIVQTSMKKTAPAWLLTDKRK